MVTQTETDELRVWVDQDLCTGDGLCVQYAPEVFEFDIDGLAYVKDGSGELLLAPGSRVDVPAHLRLDVIDAAKECPGDCIHVLRSRDEVEVAGPDAGLTGRRTRPRCQPAADRRLAPGPAIRPAGGSQQSGRPTSEATSRANSSSRAICPAPPSSRVLPNRSASCRWRGPPPRPRRHPPRPAS